MRFLLPLLVLAVAGSACRCGPDQSTPVTLRVKNPLQTPIFVDATDPRMGLKVKRGLFSGDWVENIEEPPCECLSCELVCGGCECEALDAGTGPTKVMKIAPDGSFEREWRGVVQVSGSEACSSSVVGTACLREENPPLDEVFQLELCYAQSSQGAADAEPGKVVPGALNKDSIVCVEKSFKVEDREVEISPERGAECSAHADCTGDEELCFFGGCTTACPAMGFPEVGAAWQVRVPEPDNTGFFAYSMENGIARYVGTGTVGSVQYDGNTMTVYLARPGPTGGMARGTLYVSLPQGLSVPLFTGEKVSVTVVDASADQNPENRGVVIRDDDGTLLLAADTGQKGPVLTGVDVAPFAVSRVGEIAGCQHGDCGKTLFHSTRFAVINEAVELKPGQTAEVVADGVQWKLVNVTNSSYGEAGTWCSLTEHFSWVVVNQRAQGMGP